METVITGIVLCSVPLLLLGLVAPWRWRLIGAVVVSVLGVGTGLGLGVLGLADLWVVPAGVGMTNTLVLHGAWCIFGALARTAGPLNISGPPWMIAMGMGAILGEVPAAAILSAGASSPAGAARLALAAAGGGLIGRMGDPAMLIMAEGHPEVMMALIPLGVLCALIARPSATDLVPAEAENKLRTALVAIIAVAAAIPVFTLPALLVGIVVLAVMAGDRRGHVDLAFILWTVLALILALLAIVAGLAEQIATGLEAVGELADWMGPPALAFLSAILAALTDGTALALLADGTLDRAASLNEPNLRLGLAAGIAVGGLAPLIASGSIRSGLRLWALQVLVAVLWVGLWVII